MKSKQKFLILLVAGIFILISFAVACSGFNVPDSRKVSKISTSISSTSVPIDTPAAIVSTPYTVSVNTKLSPEDSGLNKMEVWFQVDGENKPGKLVVTGEITSPKAWIGRSFYIPGYTDALKEGEHKVVEVTRGKFIKTWDVNEKFFNGTYEVALWGNSVDKASCTIDGCTSCKTRGYHVEDMLLYKSGCILYAKQVR